MQQPNQTTVVCPKPTDAQIQAQIENMHWQQKQSEIGSAWEHQRMSQQMAIDHEHYIIDHVAEPIMIILVVSIVAAVVFLIAKLSIEAGIEKNRDDNQSDVIEARKILDGKNKG